MNNNNDNQKLVPRPSTDLDFQQQLTDPFISSPYVDTGFVNKFKKFSYQYNKKGEVILDENGQPLLVIEKDLFSVLKMFTRDWRLGNINMREEAGYIRHHLDLASDILINLGDEFRASALMSFERALCVNETSQSKGGFLRKMLNTFIHKQTPIDDDNGGQKRNLLGFGKKN